MEKSEHIAVLRASLRHVQSLLLPQNAVLCPVTADLVVALEAYESRLIKQITKLETMSEMSD